MAMLHCCDTSVAAFRTTGFELIHTVPTGTSLETPDLRTAAQAWIELFDGAQRTIDIGQFYAASRPGSALDVVIDHLQQAGERGVQIRFLLEEKGVGLSDPATLDRLRMIPNLTFRTLAYARIAGGIIHAKYLVVDGQRAFVGSQNFDWRALEHIHETGLLIDDTAIASQMQAVFNTDWHAQMALSAGQTVPLPDAAANPGGLNRTGSYLIASPARLNPKGVRDSQAELVHLLNEAKEEIRVQLLDYAPLSYGPNQTRPYYPVIDTALRAAAARGVHIRLMVSNWNTSNPEIDYLKSLAVLPNVEVRVVTLPPAATGFIPYARVIHSKTLEIDGHIAWVGTSNWLGGYLDQSRNLEIVMHDDSMARRIRALHGQLWDSPYAEALVLTRQYPEPHPGTP
jgi:phosphatidylserine/phosphatidylglycerophosphate/cardiolipin synthase-like enzyme